MTEIYKNIDTIYELCWELLQAGAREPGPLHTPVLATASGGTPSARVVVLRDADRAAATLSCHTDIRSPKFRQLRNGMTLVWVFYDPAKKMQLRINTVLSRHYADDTAALAWRDTTLTSRINYQRQPGSGHALSGPHDTLAGIYRQTPPDKKQTESGRVNFSVLCTRVEAIDWYHLDESGHRRALMTPVGADCSGTWIAP